MTDSNTAPNRGGKPFTKGDPRINRKGRPKSFDALRTLAQQIGHEEAQDEAGDPVVIAGRVATVTEIILRRWSQSRDAKLQQAFIEVAYGKTPLITELTGKAGEPLELITRIVRRSGETDSGPA